VTATQFDAVAKLLRLRDPSREAARLVLVDGLAGVAAAAATGVSAQGVSNAVQRVRAGLVLAQQAAGLSYGTDQR